MLLKFVKKSPCRKYIVRLEESVRTSTSVDASENTAATFDFGASTNLDPALATHLRGCASCREALQAAELASALLHETHRPHPDPGAMFAAHVVARIHGQEKKLHSEFEFWRPIEDFAGRVVWASCVLLLVLSSALYEMRTSRGWSFVAQETLSDRFPDLVPDQPTSKDDVLISLAEKAHE